MANHPIFILGAPRSGTTFLASLLEQTDYGSPFETHFITKYSKKLDRYGDIHNLQNFKSLVSDILRERSVMQWKLRLDLDKFYHELNEDFTYRDIVEKLCLNAAASNNRHCWGDKTPSYIGDIDIIYSLFPDAKYLYIVRDGRDVALSLMEKSWGPNNVYSCAQYWKQLNTAHPILDKLENKGQLLRLRYEDLLDQVEPTTKRIYQFLEADYDQQKIVSLTNKVKKRNYNKWRKKMNPRQKKLFDRVASDTLSRFGYETSHAQRDINPMIRSMYKAHNLFFRARHLFVINVVDGIKIRFLGKEPFSD